MAEKMNAEGLAYFLPKDRTVTLFPREQAEIIAHIAALQSEADRLRANGEFLLDRLSQFEGDCEFNDETYREWGGHVIPAIERFRAALSAPTQASEDGSQGT